MSSSLLVAASLVIAGLNLSRDPGQRNLKDISDLRASVLHRLHVVAAELVEASADLHRSSPMDREACAIGSTGWWTAPPSRLQSDFVHYVVQPHFLLFAPIVYATEVFIGVSLMTGTAVRLSGLLGAAMAINLWLGLYHARGEWPWTYFFLIVVQLMFVLQRAGRSLGGDALIARSLEQGDGEK